LPRGFADLLCPNILRFIRRRTSEPKLRILDVGCGNGSPVLTKQWFPECHYSGVDIQQYNNSDADLKAIDHFYPVGFDGSGYSEIPEGSFDYIILNHVIEHMENAEPILKQLCAKLRPGGYIWIAFPSMRSLSLPSATQGTLQFCDDSSHVYLPDVREVTNILLRNGVKVLHAGRSTDLLRTMKGLAVLPFVLARRALTGVLTPIGLCHLTGFEDHVFGQRRI